MGFWARPPVQKPFPFTKACQNPRGNHTDDHHPRKDYGNLSPDDTRTILHCRLR